MASAVVMIIALAVSATAGLVMIPYFRRLKTGKYAAEIGDRFRKDEGTAKFGGAVIIAGFIAGSVALIPLLKNAQQLGESSGISQLVATMLYVMLITLAGTVEDYLKDRLHRSVGMKFSYRFVYLWVSSCVYLLVLSLCGENTNAVLLPFRLGYVSMGYFYYPVMSLLMAVGCQLFKIHDCIGGVTKYSVDGLLAMEGLLVSVFFANFTEGISSALGFCAGGALAGFLLWNLYPAKLYAGESGELCVGGVIGAMTVLSGLHFLFLLVGIGAVIDGLCALIQRLVFMINKKLVFKGNTLHDDLSKRGFSPYKIIIIFSGATLVGSVAGVMFVNYSNKL